MKRLTPILCLTLLALAFAVPARADLDWKDPDRTPPIQTDVVGGNGGSSFTQVCPPRTWLRGFEIRSGDWIDAIALECAAPEESNGEVILGAAFGAGQVYGGMGGALGGSLCKQDEGVSGIEIAESSRHFVGEIGVYCRKIKDRFLNAGAVTDTFGYTWGAPTTQLICPGGTYAFGIFGGYGTYLDRLGLICAPLPFIKVNWPSPAPPRHDPLTMPPSAIAGHIDFRPKCKSDFFWRLAGPNDFVCVAIQSRAQVALENDAALNRVDPNGAWGPKTCISGYVWREAFDGDVVCVTPERRNAVKQENALAESRRQ